MKEVEKDFIYGARAVIEALEAGKTLNKVMIQQGLKGELVQEVNALLKAHDIIPQKVPAQKLQRITRKNHQGVIAFLSSVDYHKIEQLLPSIYEQGKDPLLFILDRVTDVRNLGSIARSAECNGVDALILPSRGSALVGPDAIKTSVGALHSLPVCVEHNLKDVITYLQGSGVAVYGCTEKTDTLLNEAEFSGPVAIIMGSEENGISPEYLKMCDGKVKIPMYGKIASLNVAVSASIAMYEINRQRHS